MDALIKIAKYLQNAPPNPHQALTRSPDRLQA